MGGGHAKVPPMKKKTKKPRKKYVDKRNWKEYEKNLLARKAKVVKFLMGIPTAEQLVEELEKMNRRKRGRRYEIPDSVFTFFMFIKNMFRPDDRTLALWLSKFTGNVLGTTKSFDHSTIVKRRQNSELDLPFRLTPGMLEGRTLYADATCLRLGRGGYHRSRKYKTEARFLKVLVFTDDTGKAVDIVIGDEHDADVNLLRGKLDDVKNSGASRFNHDGSASAKDVVSSLVMAGIEPAIRASSTVVAAARRKPPPDLCIKDKRAEEKIWEKYVREQVDYEAWREEKSYSDRWPYSEGRFSVFKRAFGEEILCRSQKAIHDEVCSKFMIMDGQLPALW